MSHAATNWAYAQDVPPGPKFVLVTLADVADDSGVTWRGQQFLVRQTGFSKRTIVSHMKVLSDAKLIGRVARRRGNGSKTSDYTILGVGGDRGTMTVPELDEVPRAVIDLALSGADSSGADFAGEDFDTLQVQDLHHQRRQENHQESLSGASASVKLPKFGGKPVTQAQFDLAAAALEHMAGKMGRRIAPVTGRGEASENLKRILGRVLDWPDLTLADHKLIIDNNFAAPWWKGDPSVGVVYGPKVFEDAMHAKGAAAPKDETKAFVASMRRKFT